MLSIGAMSSGQCHYYLELSQESYYLEGGEPLGRWLGTGAESLHLKNVSTELQSLFRGFSPDDKPLVQNAGCENRQPGWDLTFSAPKSVSVLWSQADQNTQKEIQAAHAAGVEAAINYLETSAAFSRIGKAGSSLVEAGLVVAAFEHGSSRALDPQLHTHCLVLNVGVDKSGDTRTLLSKPLYDHKMAAGAIYRVQLATELQKRLEVPIEQKKSWFEVSHVPKELVEHFSKRRQAIEAALGSRGLESASAAAFAALATREAKELVPSREDLFSRWRGESLRIGVQGSPSTESPSRTRKLNPKRELTDAISAAVAHLSTFESHFAKRDLVRQTAERAQGKGLTASHVVQGVNNFLEKSPEVVRLGTTFGEKRFTTRELYSIEERMLKDIASLNKQSFRALREKNVQSVIQKTRLNGEGDAPSTLAGEIVRTAKIAIAKDTYVLNAEQGKAVRHLTQDTGRVKVVSGFAGTGKTTMLRAVREAYEKEGYQVLGCALSGVAAKRLQEGSGIKTDTLRMTIMRLYPNEADLWKHHAKQIGRALRGKPTYEFPKLKFEKKTVLVLDEASMVGTRDFALLVRAVRRAGGIFIAVGEDRQLPAIEAGGSFAAVSKRIGNVTLTEITRQKDPKDRKAVKDLAQGNPTEALEHYAKKNAVCIEASREKARDALVRDWQHHGGCEAPEKHLIFTSSNREVDLYNQLAQAERGARGKLELSTGVVIENTERTESLFVGDRVMFQKKSRSLGIENGDVGTLVAVKNLGFKKALAIQVDGVKKPVIVPLSEYKELRLAYAFTTHKLQGSTVEHAYVHLGGAMSSREMSYVQGSRHKESIRLYTDEFEAGPELTQRVRKKTPGGSIFAVGDATQLPSDVLSPLLLKMKKSDAKTLAHDLSADRPSVRDTNQAHTIQR